MKLFLRIFFPILVFISLILIISSCAEDLSFSTSSSDKLTFSADTIRFDTVFTSIGSSTRQFRIYNRSTKALKIESAEIIDGKKFSVVVDGFRLNKLKAANDGIYRDIEIGANDSLFVFVEVNIDPKDKNSPIFVSDSLVFRINGNVQRVRFEAFGQDVKILRGRTLANDTTLSGERPYLIYDSLIVAKGAKLTLQPGVRLFFHDKAFCRVDGQISAKGTVGQPIVFRGDRMDNLLPDLPFDLYPGQWGGVSISTDSYENEMEYTQIRNGLYALQLDSSTLVKQKIRLLNCVFKDVTNVVLQAINCNLEAFGCEFTNGGEDAVRLIGGNYLFSNCTLMSSFPYSTKGNPSAITLSNYTPATVAWNEIPLQKADFTNCIIYGKKQLEVNEAGKTNNLGRNSYSYLFLNCLIKANGEDDTDTSKPIHYTNNLWNKDPKFLDVSNNDSFKYDLRLDSLSEAVDKGIYEIAQKCSIDFYGNSRLSDGKPDVGAYERVKVNGK